MNIKDVYLNNKYTFSFEFFPPKTAKSEKKLYATIEELKTLNPGYVSVTYGAFGSNQETSLALVRSIKNKIGLEVVAHYTCIGAEKEKVDSFLAELKKSGIQNILALRGDPPEGMDLKTALETSPFRYAVDLVRYIRERTDQYSIGVAGYPEGHTECTSPEKDLEHLKRKVDAGADYIITQLFFDNDYFYRFCDRARKAGITVPIVPGIMPVVNYALIKKMTLMCGAAVPNVISDYFEDETNSDEDKMQFGLNHTIAQCGDLLKNGVPGIHFYTMNKADTVTAIIKSIT